MTNAEGAMRVCSNAGPAPVAPTRDAFEVAREWLTAHETVAIATVVATWGSAPVPVGGKLVIGPGERFEGSVSGGCVEADVIAEAADVLATGQPRLMQFGVADERAWRVGLPCGGAISILVERLSGREGLAFVERVLDARDSRTPLVVTTRLDTGARSIEEIIAPAGACGLRDTPKGRVLVEVLVPPVQVLLVGGGHIAQVLGDLARRIGLAVTLIDPRTGFASPGRFAGTRVVNAWPAEAMRDMALDTRSAVVTLAHIADIDDEALVAALDAPCFYIGALGSRRSHEKRLARLRAGGVGEAALARIDAPAGLAIGATGPAEIAVSILAAIVKAQRP